VELKENMAESKRKIKAAGHLKGNKDIV